jgi:hypothetical protein
MYTHTKVAQLEVRNLLHKVWILQHSNSKIPNLISLVNADVKYIETTFLKLNDIQIRNILINIYEGKNVKELPSLYCAMH